MGEPSKPPAVPRVPQSVRSKEIERRQRELFLNTGPRKKKQADDVKETGRPQRELFLNAGPGKKESAEGRLGRHNMGLGAHSAMSRPYTAAVLKVR